MTHVVVELEPWGGIVVRWPAADVWLLVDGTSGPGAATGAWLVWRGRPVRRYPVGRC